MFHYYWKQKKTKIELSQARIQDLANRTDYGKRLERKPITMVWGKGPSGIQGQSPWWGLRGGEAPWIPTGFYIRGICPGVSTQVVCFHDGGVWMTHVRVVALVHYHQVQIRDLHESTPQFVHQQLHRKFDWTINGWHVITLSPIV